MAAPKKGRPTDYCPELADKICDRLMNGESLRLICSDDDMPNKGTVMRWLLKHEAFSDQYALARSFQAEYNAEEIIEIADGGLGDGDVQRDKLRVDARKWAASKLLAKKYGDKVTTELTGKNGGPVETKDLSDNDVARRVAFLLAKGLNSSENEQ